MCDRMHLTVQMHLHVSMDSLDLDGLAHQRCLATLEFSV